MSHHTDEKEIILKNTTGLEITINGKVISPLDQRDFTGVSARKFIGSGIKPLIDSGDIIVNDGDQDLASELGASWVFGRHVSNLHFEYAESNGGSTTTATTWQEKVALNWNALDADYLIEWAAEVRVQNTNRRIGVRCRADDSTLINSIFINPSQTSGDWGPVSGFTKLTLLTGAHKIDIDFRSSNDGALVRIRNARIKVTQAV